MCSWATTESDASDFLEDFAGRENRWMSGSRPGGSKKWHRWLALNRVDPVQDGQLFAWIYQLPFLRVLAGEERPIEAEQPCMWRHNFPDSLEGRTTQHLAKDIPGGQDATGPHGGAPESHGIGENTGVGLAATQQDATRRQYWRFAQASGGR